MEFKWKILNVNHSLTRTTAIHSLTHVGTLPSTAYLTGTLSNRSTQCTPILTSHEYIPMPSKSSIGANELVTTRPSLKTSGSPEETPADTDVYITIRAAYMYGETYRGI